MYVVSWTNRDIGANYIELRALDRQSVTNLNLLRLSAHFFMGLLIDRCESPMGCGWAWLPVS